MESLQPTSNTCCRLLTGAGRSAIAVIEVVGHSAWAAIQRCVEFASSGELAVGQLRYGKWTGPAGDHGHQESVVVSLAMASSSPVFEVHCHGGTAAVSRIMEDLALVGVRRELESTTATQSILADEALAALSRCTTERMATIALDQVRGAMSDWINEWLGSLERNVESGSVLGQLHASARQLADWGSMGVRLGEAFRVVLVGAPNVGKSTLMNRLVGWDRSITYDGAGTTRDVLHSATVLEGLPIRLTDTAGLRTSEEVIEREGIRRSESEIQTADVVVVVRDTIAEDGEPQAHGRGSARWIRVFNKSDRLTESERVRLAADPDELATVAIAGEGIDELQQRIVAAISRALPPRGAAVPVSVRQWDLMEQLAVADSMATAMQILGRLSGQVSKMPTKPPERPC